MHEIGMCAGLVDLIEERAAGREVTAVRVRVGVRHAVLNEAFDQAFALVAEGTGAQGAAVELVVTPALVTCRMCGQRAESMDALALCDRCGSADVEVSGGDELVLESIEYVTDYPVPVDGPIPVDEPVPAVASATPAGGVPLAAGGPPLPSGTATLSAPVESPEDTDVSRHTR